MESFLAVLKALVPILEPIGEQGINQLFSSVVDPYLAGLPDTSDWKLAGQCFSPAMKAFLIAEIKKLS